MVNSIYEFSIGHISGKDKAIKDGTWEHIDADQ